jgi:hypothetical protein
LRVGLLVAALLLAAGGCGGSAPPVYPVQGKVLCDGKPAERALVWLHPVGSEGKQVPRPYGRVGKDGTFQLSTYGSGDGAPAGRYKVVVFWRAPGKIGDDEGPSLLPVRYTSPGTSPLPVVEIKEEPNQLRPLVLTR